MTSTGRNRRIRLRIARPPPPARPVAAGVRAAPGRAVRIHPAQTRSASIGHDEARDNSTPPHRPNPSSLSPMCLLRVQQLPRARSMPQAARRLGHARPSWRSALAVRNRPVSQNARHRGARPVPPTPGVASTWRAPVDSRGGLAQRRSIRVPKARGRVDKHPDGSVGIQVQADGVHVTRALRDVAGKDGDEEGGCARPTTARSRCFHVPSRAVPRVSSTTPETTTRVSGIGREPRLHLCLELLALPQTHPPRKVLCRAKH
jgi:hypothetical protein